MLEVFFAANAEGDPTGAGSPLVLFSQTFSQERLFGRRPAGAVGEAEGTASEDEEGGLAAITLWMAAARQLLVSARANAR